MIGAIMVLWNAGPVDYRPINWPLALAIMGSVMVVSSGLSRLLVPKRRKPPR